MSSNIAWVHYSQQSESASRWAKEHYELTLRELECWRMFGIDAELSPFGDVMVNLK